MNDDDLHLIKEPHLSKDKFGYYQVGNFKFYSKDQAIEFAKQRGFEYQIIEEQNPLILPKSYANNFL